MLNPFRHSLIGPAECPMLERWMIDTPLFSIRIHHFYRDDMERDPHDHPWWFLTFILSGGYDDYHLLELGSLTHVTKSGRPIEVYAPQTVHVQPLRRGSLRYRPAGHTHWVRGVKPGTWTLVLTGRKRHTWGFWQGRTFFPSRKYFDRYGYQPCPADDRPPE